VTEKDRWQYAYYPGCSLGSSAREYDTSLRAVFKLLGVELIEIEGWTCCGATPAGHDPLLAGALAARNLAWAEARGLDVVAPCSECFKNLHKSLLALRADRRLRDEVNALLDGPAFRGSIDVKHPLEVVVRDVGLERVRELVRQPLAGVQIAPYYGCLITRPRNDFDDPEDPSSLDDLLVALGAEVPDFYPYKTRCCGGALLLSKQDVALGLTRRLVGAARRQGAAGFALGCPMCDMLLDAYQPAAVPAAEERVPALFFTQWMGLAMGIDADRLGLASRVVAPPAGLPATARG